MRLFKTYCVYFVFFILVPTCLDAQERGVLGKPVSEHIKIAFNGEKIKGIYNIIDARTDNERAEDEKNGKLNGSVIIFLTGHAQRPADAWKFTNDLALKSRSGIVISLVCDTPYGKNKAWRGDNGKDVVLMAMIRYILSLQNIMVDGYVPVTEQPVSIISADDITPPAIHANLTMVGWSHGAILARRFAGSYPEAVDGMGQVCPAGYKDWRFGGLSLGLDFLGESARISTKLFAKQAPDILRAGSGITQGLFADGMRGFWSGLIHVSPGRMLRPMRDLKDCAVYVDDRDVPLREIEHIIVVFGRKDTVMDFKLSGITAPDNPKEEEIDRFWQTFYPSLLDQDCERHLAFLEGNHLAPIPFHDVYSSKVLKGLGQFKP